MANTDIKQQIADKLKDVSTVLVTVNSNPSVDELSAALGITLLLNKLDKHATAVFSGAIPPAIEFLQPEKTFENTANSLRDFIIALDKEKADHLRYKVDGDMVKIFITPYKTTIDQNDLEFSQGEFNVEFVIALGVQSEDDLDAALSAHGKILHDASVAALSLGGESKIGTMQWVDSDASSYSEMLASLASTIKKDKNLLDEQIANAFLTGIVASTDRFSNERTSSNTMTIAAQLMAAGANQQLVATKLEEDDAISAPAPKPAPAEQSAKINREQSDSSVDAASGALSISHQPEGTLDEVAAQVAERNSDQAAKAAEEELAKRNQEPKSAEDRFAEQLAAHVPEAGSPAAQPADAPQLRGAVSLDQWKTRSEDQEAAPPTMGGTLNATTEQAEADKRRQIADDRNRKILSHGGGYMAGEPTYQTAINAASEGDNAPGEVHDIFDDAPNPASAPKQDPVPPAPQPMSTPPASAPDAPTAHVEAIQPPAPSSPAPTLAEIDAQNRAKHDDARSAIDAALQQPMASAPNPSPTPTPAPDEGTTGLPPLPPMPDFSTLPPVPPSSAPNAPGGMPTIGPPQSSGMPTPRPLAPAPAPPDPAQFKIPGQ